MPCCLHLSMWFVLCETPRVYQSGFCNEPILSFCWMLYLLYVLFFYAHDLVRGAVEPMVDWYLENFVYCKLWFVFCKNRSARLKRLNALFYSKISAKFDLVCEWYSSQNHCKVDLETTCCECFNFFSRLERLNALFSSKISAKVDLVCEWYSSQNHCKVDLETACCECFDFCKNRFARLEGLNAIFYKDISKSRTGMWMIFFTKSLHGRSGKRHAGKYIYIYMF